MVRRTVDNQDFSRPVEAPFDIKTGLPPAKKHVVATTAEGLEAFKELYSVRTGKSREEVDAFVELLRRT